VKQCTFCGKEIESDDGRTWRHSDGRTYRHPCMPSMDLISTNPRFNLGDRVEIVATDPGGAARTLCVGTVAGWFADALGLFGWRNGYWVRPDGCSYRIKVYEHRLQPYVRPDPGHVAGGAGPKLIAPQGGSGTSVVPATPRCDGCQFWKRFKLPEIVGECRRRPPSVGGHGKAHWPASVESDFCGEFVSLNVRTSKDSTHGR
jgi:hypothetical protein